MRTGADGRFEFARRPAGHATRSPSRRSATSSCAGTCRAPAGARSTLTIPLAEGTGTYQETVTVTADDGAAAEPWRAVADGAGIGGAAGPARRRRRRSDARDAGAAGRRDRRRLPGRVLRARLRVPSRRHRHRRHADAACCCTRCAAREDTGSIAMINTDVLSQRGARSRARIRSGTATGSARRSSSTCARDRAIAPALRAAVSGTSASAVLEGPLGRASAARGSSRLRKSYLDWLIRKIEPDIDSTIGFVDGQAKLRLRPHDPPAAAARRRRRRCHLPRDCRRRWPTGCIRATSSSTAGVGRVAVRRAIAGCSPSACRSSAATSTTRGALGQELARGYTQALIARIDFARAARPAAGRSMPAAARERDRTEPDPARLRADRRRHACASAISARTSRATTHRERLGAGRRDARRRAGVAVGLRVDVSDLAAARPACRRGCWPSGASAPAPARRAPALAAQFLDPTMVDRRQHSVDPERAHVRRCRRRAPRSAPALTVAGRRRSIAASSTCCAASARIGSIPSPASASSKATFPTVPAIARRHRRAASTSC